MISMMRMTKKKMMIMMMMMMTMTVDDVDDGGDDDDDDDDDDVDMFELLVQTPDVLVSSFCSLDVKFRPTLYIWDTFLVPAVECRWTNFLYALLTIRRSFLPEFKLGGWFYALALTF